MGSLPGHVIDILEKNELVSPDEVVNEEGKGADEEGGEVEEGGGEGDDDGGVGEGVGEKVGEPDVAEVGEEGEDQVGEGVDPGEEALVEHELEVDDLGIDRRDNTMTTQVKQVTLMIQMSPLSPSELMMAVRKKPRGRKKRRMAVKNP